jgi:hypothetical protein
LREVIRNGLSENGGSAAMMQFYSGMGRSDYSPEHHASTIGRTARNPKRFLVEGITRTDTWAALSTDRLAKFHARLKEVIVAIPRFRELTEAEVIRPVLDAHRAGLGADGAPGTSRVDARRRSLADELVDEARHLADHHRFPNTSGGYGRGHRKFGRSR